MMDSQYIEQLNEMAKTIQELSNQLKLLREENEYLKKKIYGTKSETSKTLGFDQLSLFNEAEIEADPKKEQYTLENISYTRKKKQKGFLDAKLDKLPHEKIVFTLPEDQRVCPYCNTEMVPVGEEFVRHELKFIPASLKVHDIYVMTYECRPCRKKGKSVMKSTEAPEPVIPHSYTSPESVAHVMKEKYVNGVPLYRQEAEWKHLGLDLSRATMANWIITASKEWLKPIVEEMHHQLLLEHYIHADETPVQVLKEPDKKATTKSYMWVYSSIKESEHPIRIFEYKPNRSGYNPRQFLKGFEGCVITDAYSGYNNLENVTNVYCWAHARRKFVDSLPAKIDDINGTLSKQALDKIKELFMIEHEIENEIPEKKAKIRQEKAMPLLEGFFIWCEENKNKTISGSKLYKAFQYVLNHKQGLCEYVNDGNLPMTNSLDERTIRPFTTGRKNWLFSTSVKGAESSAMAYSVIESAKANGIDVYKYLRYIFRQMPGSDFENDKKILQSLMPWSEDIQKNCK